MHVVPVPFRVLIRGSTTVSRQNYLFTSESVSEGHPDKVAELKAEWDAWNADNVPAKWTPPKNKQRKNKNRPGNQARKQRGAAAAATAAGGN